MNKDTLIDLFTKAKAPANAENKEALRRVVQSFPYFQMAQVLYARQLYLDNDPDVTARIKLASAYAPDRKAMYRLFREKPAAVEENQIVKTPPAAEPKEKISYEFVYTPKKERLLQGATKPPLMEGNLHLPEPTQAATGPRPQNIPPEKVSPLSETFLEKEIAVAASVMLTEKKLAEIKLPDAGETAEIKIPEPAAPKPDAKPSLQSFWGWLQKMPMDTAGMAASAPAEPAPSPLNKNELINRFLANEPAISRPKAEFFSPSKAAKLSITDSDILASETLANIYMQQGNLTMALKAFQTLLLQNPEKKAYFAARIKEIGNLMESGNAKNK
jgi:hypothetical protein